MASDEDVDARVHYATAAADVISRLPPICRRAATDATSADFTPLSLIFRFMPRAAFSSLFRAFTPMLFTIRHAAAATPLKMPRCRCRLPDADVVISYKVLISATC